MGYLRNFPPGFDMRQVRKEKHNVGWTLPERLVGDVKVARLCIPCLRPFHICPWAFTGPAANKQFQSPEFQQDAPKHAARLLS
jgi:hypothetical protein